MLAVYYNKGKLNLFRINDDFIQCDLKDQLDQLNGLLNYDNTIRVINVD